MTHSIGNVTFGEIKNVRKSGDEEGVYYADIEISEADGFPFELSLFCARSDDHAATGKWVYQQIVDGNFEGDVRQLAPSEHPLAADAIQPQVVGAQTL